MRQKLIEWSKTILLSQAMMPRIQSAITKENEKMLTLGYGSRHFQMGMSTYDFLDKLLELNIRKKNLEELSYVVDSILDEMEDDERALLEQRFFKKKAVSSIMPKTNIRTLYRHYNTALEHFARGLIDYGYDLETLEDTLLKDRIISAIHTRVVNHSIVYRNDEEQMHDTKRADIHIDNELVSNMERITEQSNDNRMRA